MQPVEPQRSSATCNRLNPSWHHLLTMWRNCRRWLKNSNHPSILQDTHSQCRFLQAIRHNLLRSRWAQSSSEESLNLLLLRLNQNLKSFQNQNQHLRSWLQNQRLNQYLCQQSPFLFHPSTRSHYQAKRCQLRKPDSRTKSRSIMQRKTPLLVHLAPNLYQNPRLFQNLLQKSFLRLLNLL